jgi:hypothetical protein
MSGFIAGSVVQAYGANRAAKEQSKAMDRATAAEERMFNRQVDLQEPFRQVGVNALPELVEASRYTPFGIEQFQADPGYGFRLKEGLRALENSAAARGGLLSGNAMRGITRYGQELGSQEFGNAFNRYQAGFASKLNPLQALAGVGQSSANTLTGAAGQYGQSLAQGEMTRGNIRASGYANMANALTGGLNQYLNREQNQEMMELYGPRRNYGGSDIGLMEMDPNSSDYGAYTRRGRF